MVKLLMLLICLEISFFSLTDIAMRLISLENFLLSIESLGDDKWTRRRTRR